MTPSFAGLVTAGAACVLAMMLFLWTLQQKMKNAGLVDLGWALSILIMSTVYFAAAPGYPARKMLVFVMPFCWALRLSAHLLKRFLNERREDPRYKKIRGQQGNRASEFFLFFFLLQGVLAVILSAPFFLASLNSEPKLHRLEIGAFALWAVSFFGEALADGQMRKFKNNSANRGKVCQAGLWRYSRHPNYFFECLIWISYFLFALASPGGYWAAVSPALMIFFLLKVSGVPPAEEQSLLSRGDSYRRYQKTTSILVPWFKKKIV